MDSAWISYDYEKIGAVKNFPLTVKGQKFFLILNPDTASWMILTSKEYENYQKNKFKGVDWEPLFLRKLARRKTGEVVGFDFPKPAEYPSVVVVNITTKCNMHCKYCFMNCGDFQGEDMTTSVIKEMVKQMSEMPQVKQVTLEFQGGEALCNLNGIKKCIEFAENASKKKGMKFKYRIETNGTIVNDEVIELFRRYEIELGISLDGPEEIHDKARVYPNGKGTHNDIMLNLDTLRKAGIDNTGSVCTIGTHNVDFPEEIVDFFSKNNIPFKPRPVNILGRAIKNNMAPDPNKWFEAYRTLYYKSKEKNIENFSVHIFEENTYSPIRDYICLRSPCGAARELISINPNGDVYPCDGFKGVEEFKMGNIMKEKIVDMLNKQEVRKLRNRTWRDIPKCKNCMFHSMCGSCNYSCYGAFGDIYREDPQCAARKKIFVFLIKEWIRNNMVK